ncbi:MAG TPA: adenylate/guanylate cyclase domain-containing protein, partial [Leptospiraceae bacterium]|nr:adenylate/guanylate cyclase domain-containing protein [Leptospiraceae bacterium]
MTQKEFWKLHSSAHLNFKLNEKIYFILFLIFLASALHILASHFQNELFIAIAVRLNYIPVFYAGMRGGLIPGLLSGFIVASLHSIIMLHFGHATHGSHLILTEHLVETPFIVLFAALIGFLRDHEQMQRAKQEKIKEIFGKYVSQNIAEQIINNEIVLTGEEKVATILFCDLKGFTTLSEKLSPQDLLNLLNYFFSEMVTIILRNGGFLDKFIGDAIMAVFGIPFNEEKHAEIAVNVAIEMQKKLKELNESKSFGEFQLAMTIGIHTGNIIAGNLGSKERMDYTVIGDTVNLASRIQSLNKSYSSDILISDSTYKSLIGSSNIFAREIDTVKVKGRNKPCIL